MKEGDDMQDMVVEWTQTKMVLEEMRCENMDRFQLAHYTKKWWVVVKTVIQIRFI